MFKTHFIYYVVVFTFLLCNVVRADEAQDDTTTSSGGYQIIASPLNILLNLGESEYANALLLDGKGNPVEGREIEIIPEEGANITISNSSLVTNESGAINFSIFGKQEGDTVIMVSDGESTTSISVTIRELALYILPYFYGDMQLTLINPTEEDSYAKIQFHENCDRELPPVTVRLSGKEMRNIKLSEETGVTLKEGWLEVMVTEVICGGTWTNKGYLSLQAVEGNNE